jgi:hypothetical protein
MTKQQTFDIVARHLLQQNCKCEVRGRCVYRGPGGLKCAAGILIPDELYDRNFEGEAVFYDSRGGTPVAQIIKQQGHNIPLVSDLQNVHDAFDECDWPCRLKKVAKEHELKYNARRYVRKNVKMN